jgi:hypothetical protein
MSLEQLTLLGLQNFLADAEPEPLLWEAKGTELSPHEVRRQCGGFANSEQGGFLFLGVSWTGSTWRCDGLRFPDGEPHRYVTTCLTEGVRPVPSYDVWSCAVSEDRHVAVVEVQPLQAGPAIVRGTVYERVPGATIAVKDPSRLASLFARGQRARSGARASVDRMLSVALEPLDHIEAEQDDDDADDAPLFAVVAISAVTPGPDFADRLFTKATRQLLFDTARALTSTALPSPAHVEQMVAQDRRIALAVTSRPLEPDWSVTALSDGAIGVSVRLDGAGDVDRAGEVLERAWSGVARLADGLGLRGDVYLGALVSHARWWPDGARLDRGPFLLTEGPDWPAVRREVMRAAGIDVPEPEPE